MLDIGQPIPAFSLPTTSNTLISNESLAGKWVVFYFYPKDNTPGCTQEGKDFRDHHIDFSQLNAEVFGISRDSVKCHMNFKEKYGFPFELIADTDSILCKMFGVIKEKSMFGKLSFGIERSTFLIDPHGVLRAKWPKVKVAGHVEEVLNTLRELS